MNDFNNPYSSPQTAAYPTAGMPTAAHVLPPEMRIVADGLKLCLWSIIVMIVGIIGLAIIGGVIGAGARDDADLVQKLRPIVFLGVAVGGVAGILRILGLWKCTSSPEETTANGLAKVAFFSGVLAFAFEMGNDLLQITGGGEPNQIVGILSGIAGLVTLIAFVMFLSRMARYLQDAYLIEKTKSLTMLCYVIAGCMGLAFVMGVVLGAQAQGGRVNAGAAMGGGIIVFVAGLTLLVCVIWAFVVYVQTISRMSKVIEQGVR